MMQFPTISLSRLRLPLLLLAFAAAALLCRPSLAQVPDRIAASFNAADTATLKNSLHPLANAENDRGRASANMKVPLMTLAFAPTAAQKADLTALLASQQNSASPSYHQWLTPAQFGARFGMSAQDIATSQAWLQSQGFTVLDVTTARDAIHFRGTVAQVEAAFHTEMHQYLVDGTTHLANSTMLTMPSALAGAVSGIRGIAQFRPRAMHTAVRHVTADSLKPAFTSSLSGDHYLAPSDITTIYDIKALYNAGYTGSGQTIAIVGESAVDTSDIAAFRSAAGLSVNNPTLTLVPNTGDATTNSDDESESDLDLEWSGAIAQNASIIFLYAGATGDVFDALSYAIDQNAAPVVSISYGECEPDAGSDPSIFEPLFMKANSQGQTILAAAGDEGATGCDTGLNSSMTAVAAATQGLAVSYPASSSFVTAMGGTQFNEGSTNYWNSTNDSGGGSAISYIPEVAWNETTVSDEQNSPGGFVSGGGGASALFAKPSWQVATNVPNDGARDVPDISLDAAVYDDGYLLCSAGSCTNGFRDSANDLNVAGGTSFDAPIFAGVLTLINQKNSTTTGAGNINANLYALYGTAPSAFHDITAGNNEQACQSGSVDCPAGTTEIGYTAGVGYDQATGLGSIDAFNLATAFPAGSTVTTAPLLISTTTLVPSTYGPAVGTSVTLTANVTSAGSNTAPTGTVQFTVNGANVGSPVTLTPTSGTTNSTATYTTSFSATGTDTVTAVYSGNTTLASSTSSTVTLTVGTVTVPSPSFTLGATNVSVASGASVATTVTITSANGYAGTVDFSYVTSSGFTGCLFGNSSQLATANAAVTTTVTVDTLTTDCVSTGARHLLAKTPSLKASTSQGGPWQHGREYPIAAATLLAGIALAGRKRKTWPVLVVLVLAGLGTLTVLGGCGGSSSTTPISSGVPAGTYTITLTGTDSTNTSLTATTSFTVTVQ